MAIEYSILFQDGGPELFTVLDNTALTNGFELTADEDGVGFWLAGNETDFFYIRSQSPFGASEPRVIEFSFGFFSYVNSWFIRCGPNSFGSLLVLLQVLKQLASSYAGNFVCVLNGEKVVLKQENGVIHVNSNFGAWATTEVQAVLTSLRHQVADYPVV